MTKSRHIFTSGGAAHDVELSVAPASVSFASLDTAISVAAYTDEDTTDTDNLFAPAPSWSCKDPLPVGSFGSQKEAIHTVKRTLRAKFSVSALPTQDRAASNAFFFVDCEEKTINNSTGC